jgi:hypothetical protein
VLGDPHRNQGVRMSRIKIIERDAQIDQTNLTRYENQGLTLISVNRGDKKFRAPNDFTVICPWVYHFRIAGEKLHGDKGRSGTFM